MTEKRLLAQIHIYYDPKDWTNFEEIVSDIEEQIRSLFWVKKAEMKKLDHQ